MLSKKMSAAINAQITAEIYSSYLYSSMGAWLAQEGYKGCAQWMNIQVREEAFHVSKFYTYIIDRGGQLKPGAIDAPPYKWKTPLEVFQASYEHEVKVSSLINALMTLAKAEGDHASEIFIQWFVTEQVEEEANVLDIVQKLKMAGPQGAGIFAIDQQLGTRTLSPLVQAALLGTAAPTA